MQAVILAAGQSIRFYPYNITHKSLIKIMGKTILEHTLDAVGKSGINDVIIIYRDDEIKDIIGKKKNNKLHITYVKQPKPLGMGDAVLCAKDFITSDFFLMHAHHVDFHEFKSLMESKKSEGLENVLLAREEDNINKYGVLKIDGDKVLDLVEKPLKGDEPSHLRVVGIYYLKKEFLDTLRSVPPEHYHFEIALAKQARKNDVKVAFTDKETVSLKYPWDLLKFKDYLLKNIKKHTSGTAVVSKDATITGDVFIDDGAQVFEKAYIKGPCYIGKNVRVGTDVLLRNGVVLEEDSRVGAYMEMKNSYVMEETSTHSGFIGDSIIGKRCKIGALFCTANRRLDRKNISVVVNENQVDTQLDYFGSVIGNNSNIGIRVSVMPGIIIGNNVTIGPSTIVRKNTGDNVKYYSEFKEIIIKKSSEPVVSVRSAQKLVLFDIDYTLFDTAKFKESKLTVYNLYNEILDVLIKLKEHANIGIFSEGETDFQKTKLHQTDIYQYFEESKIHIVNGKDESIDSLLEHYKNYKIYLVDDKLNVLHKAQEIEPSIYTIWIKRGVYAENQKPFPNYSPDAVVTNLEGIIPLITNEEQKY